MRFIAFQNYENNQIKYKIKIFLKKQIFILNVCE